MEEAKGVLSPILTNYTILKKMEGFAIQTGMEIAEGEGLVFFGAEYEEPPDLY